MKFIIVGRNIEVTPGLRAAVEEKIGKLDKYFNPDTEVHVTLSVEKERQKIEVTIPVKGSIIRSEQVSNDMYVSIDLVEEIIERQLKKYKNKIVDKQQAAASFSKAYVENDYTDQDRSYQEVRYQAHVSRGCLHSDGTVGTQLLRILQRRDRSGKCSVQEKGRYLRTDRAGSIKPDRKLNKDKFTACRSFRQAVLLYGK